MQEIASQNFGSFTEQMATKKSVVTLGLRRAVDAMPLRKQPCKDERVRCRRMKVQWQVINKRNGPPQYQGLSTHMRVGLLVASFG